MTVIQMYWLSLTRRMQTSRTQPGTTTCEEMSRKVGGITSATPPCLLLNLPSRAAEETTLQAGKDEAHVSQSVWYQWVSTSATIFCLIEAVKITARLAAVTWFVQSTSHRTFQATRASAPLVGPERIRVARSKNSEAAEKLAPSDASRWR